jgi:DNA-binding MarR family transcriptional regulator
MPHCTCLSLEDIVNIQNDRLRTLGSKIVYMTLQNNGDADGWTKESLSDLSGIACMTRRGVVNILNRMQECGLIEKKNDRSSPNAVNQYRVIPL